MSNDIYKQVTIKYYYENLNTLDKTGYQYKDCIKRIEWLLRDDKAEPIVVLDALILNHCKEYLGGFKKD